MTVYEIVTAPKSDVPTEEKLREALAQHKVGFTVENISTEKDNWIVRLAETPDFLKKKDDAEDATDDSVDESTETEPDGSEDSTDDEGKDDGEKGDKKRKDGGDPVAEVKAVIDQLTTLFTDLGGKVQDLQTAHDDKAQKLKDIGDTVGGEGGPGGLEGGPEGLGLPGEDVGPTPGGPPAAPMPAKGLDKRKPGVPGAPGGGLPAFTNYQVATHPGVNDAGEKISLTAAANEMESDPEFVNYEVVGMTENADGTFSAKLKLKS